MKRILLISAILFMVASLVQAQYNTGSYFIGGATSLELGLGSDKQKSDAEESDPVSLFGAMIDLNGGYFVQKDFGAGGFINYSYGSQKEEDYKYADSEFIIGPLFRYYNGISTFRPVGVVKAGIGRQRQLSEFNGEETVTKHNIWMAGGGGGICTFIADNVSAEVLLNYEFTRLKNPDEDANTNNNRHLIHKVYVSFGLTIFFSSLSGQ